MHLPIHPDVCHAYVKALKDCGYQWLMVQEHTIENADGSPFDRPYVPHRLVAKNSLGEVAETTVLIKTKGSDTKLVGQMQPYYEAQTRDREAYGGKEVVPFVLQIADGENGGVMMNEFPDAYKKVFHEVDRQGVVAMNGSEYLEHMEGAGLDQGALSAVQPVSQHKIWQAIEGYGPGAADRAIEKVKEKDAGFSLDMASWTNDRNWVKGYGDVLDPMGQLSAAFHQRYDDTNVDKNDPLYKEALLYLLLSQTSCFRYWGRGLWTDYAKEICRRGMECLDRA
jgi:hypothetical protein